MAELCEELTVLQQVNSLQGTALDIDDKAIKEKEKATTASANCPSLHSI